MVHSGPMPKFGKVDSIGLPCTKTHKTSSRDVRGVSDMGISIPVMPCLSHLTNNLQVELFDVLGVDSMGPFLPCQGYEYIFLAVDYVSKWVEALPCRATDSKHAKKMLQEIIFLRFGTPRLVISDGGSHFIDRRFREFLSEVGIRHNVGTPYHPAPLPEKAPPLAAGRTRAPTTTPRTLAHSPSPR